MAQMTPIKKAWQRASRLKARGIRNAALERYEHDIKIINESGMTRAEKSKAKTEIAKRFMRAKTSTVKGIREQFKKAKESGRLSAKAAAITDLKQQAKYLDAGKETRRYLEARALGVSSDQIRYAVDMLDSKGMSGERRKRAFYQILGKINDHIYNNENVAPDDVTRLINKLGDRYEEI